VDPVTGVIVKGIEHQVRTLVDGSPALDTTLTFDDASIKYQAKQAKDGRSKIDLLTLWLPLILLVVGLLALVGAVLLLRAENRPGARRTAPSRDEPLQRV